MNNYAFKCPECKEQLEVGEERLGEIVSCPYCVSHIRLERPSVQTESNEVPPPIPKEIHTNYSGENTLSTKSNIQTILYSVTFVLSVLYLTYASGEFSIRSFSLNTVACGITGFIFLIIGSFFKSEGMRGGVFLLYICLVATLSQNAEESKKRNERENKRESEAQNIAQQRHQVWYNSLSSHDKLKYDNEQLQEENERLQEENAALSR